MSKTSQKMLWEETNRYLRQIALNLHRTNTILIEIDRRLTK